MASIARRAVAGTRTATVKHANARTASGSASHPASDDSRIVVSIGVLCDTPTATTRAASGIAAANSGLTVRARP